MRKYYGIWPGLVIDNADPDRSGKIKVRVPQVHGGDQSVEKIEDEEIPWAFPCTPFSGKGSGLIMVPEIGSGAWIIFQHGDIRFPVFLGSWFGVQDLITEHTNSYAPTPKSYIIKTPGGHQLLLSDLPATEQIKMSTPLGQLLELNDTDSTTQMFSLGEHLHTVGGNHTTQAVGDIIANMNNYSVASRGLITMTALATVTLSALAAITLSAGAALTIGAVGAIQVLGTIVNLGLTGSFQKLCNLAFLNLFNTHTHLYSPGPDPQVPTGPPVVQGSENTHTTEHVQAS